MVRSDLAASGVIFSIDTESGFKDAILITGGYPIVRLFLTAESNVSFGFTREDVPQALAVVQYLAR